MTPDDKRAWVEENIGDQNAEAIFFVGLEDALVGYAQQFSNPPVAVYDFDGIIRILMKDGSSEEDAIDHFGFNIAGTWAGPHTPFVLYQIKDSAAGRSVFLPEPLMFELHVDEELGPLPTVRDGEP